MDRVLEGERDGFVWVLHGGGEVGLGVGDVAGAGGKDGEVGGVVGIVLEQQLHRLWHAACLELDAGFVLTCQSVPTTDAVIVDFDR